MNDMKEMLVWDRFVRVFHWSLMFFIFLAYVTSEIKGPIHKYIGFVVFGLVVIRIFWGFWGTKYALFSNFLCSPVKALTYLKELAIGKPTHYTGHNPAAAWMILLLLTSSIIICLTGYADYSARRNKLPVDTNHKFLIVENSYADAERNGNHGGILKKRGRHKNGEKEDTDNDSVWSEVHEAAAQFMLFLILFHVLGVAISSRAHNENLVKAMITGKKVDRAADKRGQTTTKPSP